MIKKLTIAGKYSRKLPSHIPQKTSRINYTSFLVNKQKWKLICSKILG